MIFSFRDCVEQEAAQRQALPAAAFGIITGRWFASGGRRGRDVGRVIPSDMTMRNYLRRRHSKNLVAGIAIFARGYADSVVLSGRPVQF